MAQTLKFVTEYGIETVGLMSISSGTAADPGLFFSADGDTGFFSPSSNSIALSTGGSERFRISSDGALGIAGANYGTSGQFLRSGGGAAAPSWASAVTSVDVSGGTTGLTTSGGPITGSGTITLAGTLAIANGGTGQTTASTAFTALAPSQTGHSGKYLTTNGTSASWSTVAWEGGTVSSGTITASSNNSLTISGGSAANAPIGGALLLLGGDGQSSDPTGGDVTVKGGKGGSNSRGGHVYITGGQADSSVSGNGGNVYLSTGVYTYLNNPNDATKYGAIIFRGHTTERFRMNNSGSLAFGGASNYGTSGQFLTSNGDASPSWQTFATLPSQTGHSGKYLTTDGTSASWGTAPAAAANTLTGTTLASNVVSSSLTSLGVLTGLTVNGTITSYQTGGGIASALVISGADNSNSGDRSVTVRGGNGILSGNGGDINVGGGSQSSSGTAGSVNITGGLAGDTGTGGSVNITAGTGRSAGGNITGTSGVITFSTYGTSGSATAVERLRITSTGAFAFSGASNYGTSGQVLVSNGNAAPSWQTISGTGTVTSVDVSGGTTGLTTSGGPVTSSGTITLAGTLAIANGGTGQTTASGAINALVPSQTGNSGRYLTTDGTSVSWATVSGGASLPSQTGNSGRFLTTDGTTASWGSPFTGAVSFGARYDELSTSVTASASTSIDCSLGNNFVVTMAASITTLTLSNVPTSGRVYNLTLYVTQDATGGKTITWPGSVRWPSGTAPTLTTTGSKIDVLTLVTYDGGSNWLGFVAGQNF